MEAEDIIEQFDKKIEAYYAARDEYVMNKTARRMLGTEGMEIMLAEGEEMISLVDIMPADKFADLRAELFEQISECMGKAHDKIMEMMEPKEAKPEWDFEDVKSMLEDGAKLSDIAEKYGRSYKATSLYCRKHGIGVYKKNGEPEPDDSEP